MICIMNLQCGLVICFIQIQCWGEKGALKFIPIIMEGNKFVSVRSSGRNYIKVLEIRII